MLALPKKIFQNFFQLLLLIFTKRTYFIYIECFFLYFLRNFYRSFPLIFNFLRYILLYATDITGFTYIMPLKFTGGTTMKKLKDFFPHIPKIHIDPNKIARMVTIGNRYSLLFHALLSMLLCFAIESISRHSILKSLSFFALHTWAFAYNSFLIFASLSLVYLIRRRTLGRIVISGFWLFLGKIGRAHV